jgi:hypothetical protein
VKLTWDVVRARSARPYRDGIAVCVACRLNFDAYGVACRDHTPEHERDERGERILRAAFEVVSS